MKVLQRSSSSTSTASGKANAPGHRRAATTGVLTSTTVLTQNPTTATVTAPTTTTTTTPNPSNTLHYGDRIQLFATSHYTHTDGGLIGVYRKRFQSLFVLNTTSNKALTSFAPSTFTIRPCAEEDQFSSNNTGTSSSTLIGSVLKYGDPFVLLDANGRSWNNRTGVRTGYCGPRKKGKSGEMFLIFSPRTDKGQQQPGKNP